MQEGSLVVCDTDMTPLTPAYLQIVGIIPKPSVIFTCSHLFKVEDTEYIVVEECKLVAMRTNLKERFAPASFIAKHWHEVAPPQTIDIDELMPEGAFAEIYR